MVLISIDFLLMPEYFGGHRGPPYENMRTLVRWPQIRMPSGFNLPSLESLILVSLQQ